MAGWTLLLCFAGCVFWSVVSCYDYATYEYEATHQSMTQQRSDFDYNCTFTYGLCGWRQVLADDFDWTLNDGSTGSMGTGPNGGLTNSNGRYLYIETSSPGDKAKLEGLTFDIEPWEIKCFSFWYNMYGSSIGRLSILTEHSSLSDLIWTLDGNQGQGWHHGHVNITGNGQIKLVIEGVSGINIKGDIAIDDTELTDGKCTEQSDSSDYEQATSNPWWRHQTSDYIPWWRHQTSDYKPWWISQTSDYIHGATQVRLEGGNSHSGRVAIYHNGQWGTICDDQFDHNDVTVICRMLGLNQGDGYGVAYGSSHFGPGSGPILLDNLGCYGHEADVSSCNSNGWYHNDCGHAEDAGVDCYAPYFEQTTGYPWWTQPRTDSGVSVRLIHGPNYHSGTVQLYRNGVWGTVCDDSFDHNDVMVICRMLGIHAGERYGRAYTSAYFGQGSGPILLDELRCYGYESEIGNCRSSGWGNSDCSHSEDAGLDCYAYAYEMTTEYPWWIHQTSSQQDGKVRLVGRHYYSGRVEVYNNGQWGTICDDSFDNNDAKVICRMLGIYKGEHYGAAYSQAYFGQGTGPIIIDDLQCYGYETDIRNCPSTHWYQNNCDHGEDAGVDCYAYVNDITSPSYTTYPWWLTTRYYTSYHTTFPWWRTTYNPWWTHYTTYGYKLQDAIVVNCNEYTWDVKVDMNRLRQIYPNAKGSDIYMGENKCTGMERNGHLTFQQGLDECLTSETVQHGVHVYNNELIYAERDPVYLFIIRHYNWTIGVECDVQRDGSVYGVVNNNEASTIPPSVSSQHYPVNISFYLDPNFIEKVSGSPLHADVGAHVYVKVFTTTFDWNANMRVHTCYTKPTASAPDHMRYYLIKNGCEVDTNTHIISQSTHETRFMFDQFEYTSNHEGIFVYCDTIFCHPSDWSTQCRHTCNPVIKRKLSVEKIQQGKQDDQQN